MVVSNRKDHAFKFYLASTTALCEIKRDTVPFIEPDIVCVLFYYTISQDSAKTTERNSEDRLRPQSQALATRFFGA